MTPRQRVLKTLNHQQPDRPPVFVSVTPQIGHALNKKLDLHNEGLVSSFFANRISFTEALLQLGNDCICVASTWRKGFKPQKNEDGSVTDEWRIKWKSTGMYDEMVGHPLAEVGSVSDLDNYPFPDPEAKGRFDFAEKVIGKYGNDYAIIGEQECTIFELSWYLVGLEKFMIDLAMRKNYIFELMDRVMEINLKQACRLVELGVDIIWTGDDVGNQNGMMMSPDLWRDVFKPRMAYVFQILKKVNPELKIAYHSCGSILPIIPDLIEIGLDILNPIQPNAAGMDAKFLKDTYGDQLSFFGGIDIQNLLPNGSPEEVKSVVKEKATLLGKRGGYILAPAHNIQPDTPLNNIFALYEAVKEISS